MSKSETHYIARIQNPETLGGVHIIKLRAAVGEYIAAISVGVGDVQVTRAQLVSLRDQIDQWLDAHPLASGDKT